jgi:hypothetical protein
MITGSELPIPGEETMTRKHYKALAEILAEAVDAIRSEDRGDWGYGDAEKEEEGFRRAVESLSGFLISENPRFDSERFRIACGLGE